MTYANTNEKLYDDIELWEKTDGKIYFSRCRSKKKAHPRF